MRRATIVLNLTLFNNNRYMFAAGALPRIFGPSWSLAALNMACSLEGVPCGNDGSGDGFLRTWLEFYVTSFGFIVGLILVVRYKKQIQPYHEE